MKKLIYAVDDEESIRELYKYSLENAGFECVCFSSGEELFSGLKDKAPDLFILDIMLDGINGYEILHKIEDDLNLRRIPVIMVSAKGEEINKVKGLDMGAADYLSKPFGILELIARINAALRKSVSAQSEKIGYKNIEIDDGSHSVKINGKEVGFTLKEYQLLSLFIKRNGFLVTREDIYNAVWEGDFMGETRTVDMHINNIRKKLLSNDSKVSIDTVRGTGFILK